MALRLAAILALTNYYEAPWPTIAKGRVFDSRIDPIQGADKTDLIPTIAVYTDDDIGDALSMNNGGPPFRRNINLVMWLTLGQIGEDTDLGEQTIIFPQTDSQLEATLDLFEHQTRFALANFQNPWARIFLLQWQHMTNWRSERMVTEANVRLAARQLTATIEIHDDELPDVTTGEIAEQPLPENIQTMLNGVQQAGAPRGDVAYMIGMLKDATIPTLVKADALRSVKLMHTHPNDTVTGKAITPSPIATADLNGES